jgi:hypothetical protein
VSRLAFPLSLFLAIACGCGLNSSSRSQLDRAMALMNQARYADASATLESLHSKNPSDSRVSILLAQANLGQANLEMLDLANQVMSSQPPSPVIELSSPPDCPTGAIHDIQGADARCLVYRVIQLLPRPDEPHVIRARDVLRAAFPDPKTTDGEINFLAAYVELASALARVKAFLVPNAFGGSQDAKFTYFVHHAKAFLDELQQGLLRARYSYRKVSKFVANLDGKPLIKVGDQELVFSEDIGIPTLLRFAASVVHESADSVDSQLSAATGSALGGIGSGFVSVLQALDVGQFGGAAGNDLEVMWKFEPVINSALNSVADSIDKTGRFDLFSLTWSDPPRLFAGLVTAADAAWNGETPAPLRGYLQSTQGAWDELEALREGWTDWVNLGLAPAQRDSLTAFLSFERKNDPRLGSFPAELTMPNLKAWQVGFTAGLSDALAAYLTGTVPNPPELTADQAKIGWDLLQRSQDWAATNLWTQQTSERSASH